MRPLLEGSWFRSSIADVPAMTCARHTPPSNIPGRVVFLHPHILSIPEHLMLPYGIFLADPSSRQPNPAFSSHCATKLLSMSPRDSLVSCIWFSCRIVQITRDFGSYFPFAYCTIVSLASASICSSSIRRSSDGWRLNRLSSKSLSNLMVSRPQLRDRAT